MPPKKSHRRILKELEKIQNEDNDMFTAEPIHPDDLSRWQAVIKGPPDSPYEGGEFKVEIQFPAAYPFEAPKLRFVTRVYHCNVDTSGGICLDILKGQWSPALSISKVLISLCSLLTDPNADDPLRGDVATLFRRNRKKHDATARQWTQRHAMPKGAAKKKAQTKKKKAPAKRTRRPRRAAAASSSSSSSSSNQGNSDDVIIID